MELLPGLACVDQDGGYRSHQEVGGAVRRVAVLMRPALMWGFNLMCNLLGLLSQLGLTLFRRLVLSHLTVRVRNPRWSWCSGRRVAS